jgi:hypothetical protein
MKMGVLAKGLHMAKNVASELTSIDIKVVVSIAKPPVHLLLEADDCLNRNDSISSITSWCHDTWFGLAVERARALVRAEWSQLKWGSQPQIGINFFIREGEEIKIKP